MEDSAQAQIVKGLLNNGVVVILSGLFSLVVSIWHEGSTEGARNAQISFNAARIEAIEKYGTSNAREEIIKLHDMDEQINAHLESVDKNLASNNARLDMLVDRYRSMKRRYGDD